jgi:hypothetical protein
METSPTKNKFDSFKNIFNFFQLDLTTFGLSKKFLVLLYSTFLQLTASGVLYGWSALVLVLTKEGTYLNYCKEGETNVKYSKFNTKSAQKDNINFHLRSLVELFPLDFQIL